MKRNERRESEKVDSLVRDIGGGGRNRGLLKLANRRINPEFLPGNNNTRSAKRGWYPRTPCQRKC